MTIQHDPYSQYVTANFLPEGFAGEKTWTDPYGNTYTLGADANFTTTKKLSGLPTVQSSATAAGRISITPSALDFSTVGNWTLEAWVNPTSIGGANFFTTGATGGPMNGFFFGMNASGNVYFYVREYYAVAPGSVALVGGQWNHIAAVGQGNNISLYVNGQLSNTGAVADVGALGVSWIGYINGDVYGNPAFDGYFGQIRITKGVARYTGPFTPSTWFPYNAVDVNAKYTSLYLDGSDLADKSYHALAVNNIGGVSVSPTASAFGGTSLAFSGSNRLEVPYSDLLNLSSGDFTIEADVYLTAYQGCILSKDQHYGSTFVSYKLGIDSTGRVQATIGSGTNNSYVQEFYSTATLNLSTWHSVALVRSGNTLTIFVDGVADNTLTVTGTIEDSGANLWIGNLDEGGTPWGLQGYIQQLRITKGLARYTSNYRSVGLPYAVPASNEASDSHWADVSLYMDFDGLPVIADKSIIGNPVTVVTDATTTDTPTTVSGYASNGIKLDGSYLSIPSNEALVLSDVTSFTLEAMVFLTSYPNEDQGAIFCKDALWGVHESSYHMGITSTGVLEITVGNPNSSNDHFTVQSTNVVPLNQWVHVAMVRDGTNFYAFVNGIGTSGTSMISSMTDIGGPLLIGSWQKSNTYNTYRFHGLLDNLRITKGVARYTSNFQVNNTSTILHLRAGDSVTANSLVDSGVYGLTEYMLRGVAVSSAQPFISGGKSFHYSGSAGNAIVYPNIPVLGLGTRDFTLEMHVYPDNMTTTGALFDFRTDGSYDRAAFFLDSGTLTTFVMVNGNVYGQTGPALVNGQWNHIAFTRLAGTTTCWVNGAVAWTTNAVYDLATSAQLGIGSCATVAFGSNPFKGYADDIRIIDGIAVYTAPFTPASVYQSAYVPISGNTPDPVKSQVSLLLHAQGYQGSTIVKDSGYHSMVGVASNVSHDKAQTIVGVSSLYANGSNSYILYPEHSTFGLSVGDFTLEGWFYPTAVDGDRTLFDFRLADGSDKATFFLHNAQLSIWGAGGVAAGETGTLVVVNQWQHIAFSRNNGTITAWLNGQQVWSTTTVYDIGYSAPLAIAGGSFTGGVGTSPFQGYFSEIRITKGTGRYTAPFTPSAAPLTTAARPAYTFTDAQHDAHASAVKLWLQDSVVDTSSSARGLNSGSPLVGQSNRTSLFGSTALSFSGTYLVYDNSADFSMASVDYTYEAWVYPKDTGSYGIFSNRGLDAQGWALQTNGFRAMINGMWSDNQMTSFTALPAGRWTHVVLERHGDKITLYYNGVIIDQVSGVSTVDFPSAQFTIGASATNGENAFNGYMQGIRFTQGVARYATLASPLVPSAAYNSGDVFWDNTTALLHFDQGSVSNTGDYVNTNTATPDSSQFHQRVWAPFGVPNFTGDSNHVVFGNSVYLAGLDSNEQHLYTLGGYGTGNNTSIVDSAYGRQCPTGTENFTLEAFFFPYIYPGTDSSVGNPGMLFHWWDGSTGINVELRPDGTVGTWVAGVGTYIVTTATMPVQAWTHVTLTRQGDHLYLYFNGAVVATIPLPTNYYLPNVALYIGGDQTTSGRNFKGFVDEFRLTKGVARLSPTSAFISNAGAAEYPDTTATVVATSAVLTTTTGTITSSTTTHLVFSATGLFDVGSYYVVISANGQTATQTFTPDGSGNATVQIDVTAASFGVLSVANTVTYQVQAFMSGVSKSPVASITIGLTPTFNASLTTTSAANPHFTDTVSFTYHIDAVPVTTGSYDLVIYANGSQQHLLGLGGTAGQPLDTSFNIVPESVGITSTDTSITVTAQLYLANYGFIGPVETQIVTLGVTPVVTPTGTLSLAASSITTSETVALTVSVQGLSASTMYSFFVTGYAGANTTFTTDSNGAGSGIATIDPVALQMNAGSYSITGSLLQSNNSQNSGIVFTAVPLTITTPVASDPVVFVLGQGSSTIVDQSTYAHVLSVTNATVGPVVGAPATSVKFTGSSSITSPSTAEFDLGTHYTIEGFVFPTTSSGTIINRGYYYSMNTGSWVGLVFNLSIVNSNLVATFTGTSPADVQTISAPIQINQRSYVAMVRSGTNGYLFINGSLVGTVANLVAPVSSNQGLTVGTNASNDYPGINFTGSMDNIVITKSAKYTSDFVVPVVQVVGSGSYTPPAPKLVPNGYVGVTFNPNNVHYVPNTAASLTVDAPLMNSGTYTPDVSVYINNGTSVEKVAAYSTVSVGGNAVRVVFHIPVTGYFAFTQ